MSRDALRTEFGAPNLRTSPEVTFIDPLSPRCSRCTNREDLITLAVMADGDSARDAVTLCVWCLAEGAHKATGWRFLAQVRQNVRIRASSREHAAADQGARESRTRRTSAAGK